MKCKEHPTYVPRRMPAKTVKYPDGCPTCIGLWESAKTDPKRLVKTVNIELTPEETRRTLISLDALLSHGGRAAADNGPLLRRLYFMLSEALRQT